MSTALALKLDNSIPAHLRTGAALGNENLSAKDLATPELSVLQALSPEVTKGKSEFIKGAEAGHILNSVTKELLTEVYVANLFTVGEYAVFKKRALGGGDFQGAHPSAEAATAHLQSKGLNVADYDIAETATHTVAVIDPVTGEVKSPAIVRFTSSGLRVARDWNTAILVNQPNLDRFAGVYKLSSAMRSNSKGTWFVLNPEFMGFTPEATYQELRKTFLRLRPAANDATAG